MAIIPDTLSGALVLSVFDFVACFFVLWGISFLIRGLSFVSNKFPDSTDDSKKSSQ
ncbi:hypothetical protein [Desulfitobacterium sp.]|uniref:hypothetical protein n=1 Tax=Desulfitobacterium sp. TaxID=49981 RepID=UPI002C4D6893|nr:hypothetical protein [Desulfitobacterium sp.]HVJ47652.1 hypothetical protein [Desulfitobacterium sp.]